MYTNVSSAFRSKIAEPSRRFTAKLVNTADATDFIDSGFEKIEFNANSIPNSNNFTIGGTVSSYINVTCATTAKIATNKEYELQIGLYLNDGTVEYVPMGYFTPEKPKTNTDGRLEFTAYDRMVSKLSQEWETKLTYPATTIDILTEIEQNTGMTVTNKSSLSSINVPYLTDEIPPFDGYTYRSVIGFIASMYGRYATINRSGEIYLSTYTTVSYTVNTNMSYDDITTAEETYNVGYVACIVNGDTENVLKSGTGKTGIVFDCPVMSQTLLNQIYNNLKSFSFLPATLSCKGDPRIGIGDRITVVQKDNTTITVPIMHIKFTFDGGLAAEIGSYGGTEASENAVYNTDTYTSSNLRRVSNITKDLNGLSVTVSETRTTANTAKTTAESAKKTAEDTQSDLKANYSTTSQVESKISTSASSIKAEVSRDYTTKTEFENLDVSGVQRLPDTNVNTLNAVNGTVSRYFNNTGNANIELSIIEVTDTPIPGIKYGVKANIKSVSGSQNNRALAWRNTEELINLTDGESYIASVYVRIITASTEKTVVRFNWANPTNHASTKEVTSHEWVQVSFSFVWAKGTNDRPSLYFGLRDDYVGEVEMCGFKLEKGTKATDWSEAPIETTTLSENVAKLTLDAEQFRTEVSQTYTPINLFKYPYYSGASRKHNGITWTANADGTVSASGTATANSYYYMRYRTEGAEKGQHLDNGTYVVSGLPDGGSSSTWSIAISRGTSASSIGSYKTAYKTDTFTVSDGNSGYLLTVQLFIYSGQTVNNLVFKPMLEPGTKAHKFAPYSSSPQGTVYTQSVAMQTADGFSWLVSGDSTSNFEITQNGINAISDKFTVKGSMIVDGDLSSLNATIGDWAIEENRLSTTGNEFVGYTKSDFTTIANYVKSPSTAPLSNKQKNYLDVNKSGAVDLTDAAAVKLYLLKGTTTGITNKPSVPISVKFNANDPDKVLDIVADRSAYELDNLETKIGVKSIETPQIVADVIKNKDGNHAITCSSIITTAYNTSNKRLTFYNDEGTALGYITLT